jgi:AcrR family transcriptional regulator
MTGRTAERRRGTVLEDAILDAAWGELTEKGYGRFTIDAVATRARTSRPVLYRRWPQRGDLALSALQRHFRQHPVTLPETGTLRGDLLALMRQVSSERAGIAIIALLKMADYFEETQSTLATLRMGLLPGDRSGFDAVIDRAIVRGEIDAGRLTTLIRALPASWLRQEIIMNFKPPPQTLMIAFLDEIFLPLVGISTLRPPQPCRTMTTGCGPGSGGKKGRAGNSES